MENGRGGEAEEERGGGELSPVEDEKDLPVGGLLREMDGNVDSRRVPFPPQLLP